MASTFEGLIEEWGGPGAEKEIAFVVGKSFGKNWNLQYDPNIINNTELYRDCVTTIVQVSEIIYIHDLGLKETTDYINTRANRLLNEQEEIA